MLKEKLAKDNGFELHRIDCSDFKNVEETILNYLKDNFPNLNYNIDIKDCIEKARCSTKLKIWELFNDGYTPSEIKKELNLKSSFLTKTLQQGAATGIIIYDPHNITLKNQIYELWGKWL